MDLSKENMDTASEETVVAAEEECAEQDTETLKKQNEELEDKYMRLAAEYDNYQKRTQREKDALYADAVIDTAAQILFRIIWTARLRLKLKAKKLNVYLRAFRWFQNSLKIF